ncbi:MAG TPA: hypothetical protein VMT19_05280 [Thermoanaerobaculaceae bacterium]|nr:hypothetical protein [Thermoanaerobaculaceae bacterium]
MMIRRVATAFLILGFVTAAASCKRAAVTPPAAMAGHWEGKADVAVNWCNAKELPVSLTINRDGSVAGKLGDATLKGGHLYPNPGKPPKGFMLQTSFVVEADLDGPLVAAEGIARSEVCIPVEVDKEGRLTGAFLTSGSEYGGKSERVFSGGLQPLTKGAGH